MRSLMDATYHALSSGDFAQDWTDVNQITVNDNWSGVHSIVGFLSGLGTASGADPATITGTSTTVDVNANQTNPNTFTTGGVTEFELADPTIGMQGSNSAGSPYIQIHVDTSGVSSVDVSYLVRDLDSSADNAIQKVALQYRTSPSGTWTNVPGAYVADATTVSTATQVTPVAVTLPAEAGNQAQLQVRIITGNAAGNDEAVGIDNIVVKPTPIVSPPGNFQVDSATLRVREDGSGAVITVTRQGGSGGAVTVNYATTDGTAVSGQDYTASSGTLSFADGEVSKDVVIPVSKDALDELTEEFTFALSNPTGGAGLNPSSSRTVKVVDANGQQLSSGPLVQDWSNADLISSNDNWDSVQNITGYLSDAERDAGIVDVIANQANPAGQSQGGVGEFDGLADPTVALQGSTAAPTPQLVFDVNTQGMSAVDVKFDARDIDGSTDNAEQSISIGYRIGSSGDFTEIGFLADATSGPSLADMVTPMLASLPGDALGQELVQVRIATFNAAGNDEWVGIDNIRIGGNDVVNPAPTLVSSAFAFETSQALAMVFDQDVSGSLEPADLVITNTTTNTVVDASGYALQLSAAGSATTATLQFSSVLPDGMYSVSIAPNSIHAPNGPGNESAINAGFHVLVGDFDRDGTVNFNDLLILAANYGQSGRTFSQGNADYSADGTVAFSDLLQLASRYGTKLFSNVAVAAPSVTSSTVQKDANDDVLA
ncbi:MAG: Calx-beta domain-containing protein [Tepidisphaeraceae bacterium]